jgi:hypothetical protein
MPINVAVNGDIRGWPPSVTRRMRDELAEAVAELGFADLFRGPGTVAEVGNTRIDVQGPWTNGGQRIGNNIQAQVGKMSIAALRIADTLGGAVGALNQNAVLQQAQAALNASVRDGQWRELTGTSP